MNVESKEKVLAILAPLSYLLAGYVFAPLMVLIPIGIYLYSKRCSLEFSRLHSLKLIDFIVTLFVYTLGFGAVYFAVEMVEKDLKNTDSIFVLGNEVALGVFMVVAVLYILIPTIIAIYKASIGQVYNYPLSLRAFEKFGGRNGSNKSN